MEAVRVPPSAWITSQSRITVRSPRAAVSTTARIEHEVDPAPARQLLDTIDHILGAGIDRPLNAASAKKIVLCRGGDTDHLSADDGREIDGREADTASGGMDQHRLARAQPPHGNEKLVCSEIGYGQRRTLCEVEARGQSENLLLPNVNVA